MKLCMGKVWSAGLCAVSLLVVGIMGFWGFWVQQAGATHIFPSYDVTETEDVRKTKHNMTKNTDIKVDPTSGSGTTEVCVFCHTPHGSNTQLTGHAPIWNRNVRPRTDFSPYTAPNFDASGTDPGRPKGVSLACLSCHDGVIAIDALVNAPGSGGFEILNRGESSTGQSIGFTFNGPMVDGSNSMTGGNRDGTEYFDASVTVHPMPPERPTLILMRIALFLVAG